MFVYGSKSKINAPCKDCPDRHIGCHGECEAYQTYNADRERIRASKKTAIDMYEIQKKRNKKWKD